MQLDPVRCHLLQRAIDPRTCDLDLQPPVRSTVNPLGAAWFRSLAWCRRPGIALMLIGSLPSCPSTALSAARVDKYSTGELRCRQRRAQDMPGIDTPNPTALFSGAIPVIVAFIALVGTVVNQMLLRRNQRD